MKIIQICGTKKTGKTTITEMLIKAFTEKGYNVGSLKHDGHDFEADVPGTDSYRHFHAGACKSIVFSDTKVSIVERKKYSFEELIQLFDVDILFIEGGKQLAYPKLEILRKGYNEKSVCNKENLLGYITDFNYISDLPVFNFSDCKAIVEFIEKVIRYGN